MIRARLAAAALASAALVAACTHAPYALSAADQRRFGKDLVFVNRPGAAAPLILGAEGCTLYRARIERENIVGWDVTLASDWGATSYPGFMTACVDQSLAWDGKYVRVYFCARALGAGGGCNNGGYYRSKTGARPWEIGDSAGGPWEPLPR